MEGLRTLSEWDTRDPIRNLWRNVLIVVIEDLVKKTTVAERFKNYTSHAQKTALEYFTIPNSDFANVCEFAGFDHNFVRRKVLKAVNQIKLKEDQNGKSYMSQMQGQRVQASTY